MLGHELVYLKKPETQTQPKPKLQPIFLDLKKKKDNPFLKEEIWIIISEYLIPKTKHMITRIIICLTTILLVAWLFG